MTIGTISILAGITLLILFKLFGKQKEKPDQREGNHGIDHDEFFTEELEFDRTWSHLPGNIFNED